MTPIASHSLREIEGANRPRNGKSAFPKRRLQSRRLHPRESQRDNRFLWSYQRTTHSKIHKRHTKERKLRPGPSNLPWALVPPREQSHLACRSILGSTPPHEWSTSLPRPGNFTAIPGSKSNIVALLHPQHTPKSVCNAISNTCCIRLFIPGM